MEEWRNRPIEGDHPYLYLDGIVMKRTWGARCVTSRCWWPARSMPRAIARSSASAKAPRRTVRLVGVSAPPGRPRSERRAADHLGCLPRLGRKHRRLSARGALAALHGAFLPQRV
ncbi:hypothetical protein [Phyllobacterium salinisoli]|uniref:hypothetical protein n=1 Tax=Phyllobacterium salinisoli TaxID=1899321 RepID=UPI002478D7F0|nr:hypothetical protein [Phyllobacterium salinisoli]